MEGRIRRRDHREEPTCQLTLGVYTLYCLCSSPNHSVDDELALEGKPKRARPKLKRKSSLLAQSLGRRLSALDPESEGLGAWRRASSMSLPPLAEGEEVVNEDEVLHIDVDDIEEVKAFKAAVNVGRYIEAAHELHRLEEAGVEDHHHHVVFDDRIIVERVNRIAHQYDKSLGMFDRRLEDLPVFRKCPEEHLDWGFEFVGDILRFEYKRDEPDLDIMLGFAGMQERDLHMEFNKGLTRVNTLGTSTQHDNFWHALSLSKTTQIKNDSAAIISGLDALDEMSALWGAMYTPSEEAIEVNGIKVPALLDGHTRTERFFQAWILKPLSENGDRTHGFSLRLVTEIKLPKAIASVLSWMPSWSLKGVAHSRALAQSKDFQNFLKVSAALRERLEVGPRASFYALLRERLGGGGKQKVSNK